MVFIFGKRKEKKDVFQPSIESIEYKMYKRKFKRKIGWYEKLAKFAGNILEIEPDEKTKRTIEAAATFTGMDIEAKDVMALSILSIIIFVSTGIIFAISGIFNISVSLIVILFGLGLGYYLLKYPENSLKAYRIQASSQVVLAILYMVVSMRVVPNLEKAIQFAASNITGPLAWELRKILWDIELGIYNSANDALTSYIAKWKPENEEFAESLRLIRDSLHHPPERAEKMLDESLDVILNGTKSRMKRYAQELKMPVMVIHMMGMVLPVLGSIMAPLAAIFLADVVRMEYFFVGYDILLPLLILWFINSVLKKRPATFSQVDTSMHPEIPPPGHFYLNLSGKRIAVPVLPISLLVLFLFLLPPIFYFSSNPQMLLPSQEKRELISLVMSLFITLGIGFGLATYFFLTSFQSMGIQSDVQQTEGEFELALFQLGNRVAGGLPAELALETAIEDVKDLKISGLFAIALRNIRNLGMTFRESIFDKKYGAILYYPSRLIKNIMGMIVDIAQKGIRYAAEGMLTVSKYLRNLRETQEYIRELLSDTISSMTFQAYMLTPMVTGLIVSMSDVIIKVLTILLSRLAAFSSGENVPVDPSQIFGFSTEGGIPISAELFQIVIGIYVIEMIIILAVFLTKITYGDNKVVQNYNAGKMLFVALVMYLAISIITASTFGNIIAKSIETLT